MPKVTLEFTLPDEQEEFDLANHGVLYAIVLEDYLEYIRKKLKYEEVTKEQAALLTELRTYLIDLKNDRGLP